MEAKPTKIALLPNCKRIIKENNRSTNKNKPASDIEIFFDVSGLTMYLSISKSIDSNR